MIVLYLLIIAVAVLLLLNSLYKRTNHFNNQFVDVRKFWKSAKRETNLQIVNLGSNHPKFGLDYTNTGVKGGNWAVGPQTFEYDFAILRQNASYLSPGATVVIPVCLLQFFLYRQKNRATHAKYYTFLPKENIVGYSVWEKVSNLYFPIIHPYRLRFIIKDVKIDNRFELSNSLMTSESQLTDNVDYWIKNWNKEFCINLPNPRLSEDNQYSIQQNIQVLEQMLLFCKSHGLKPVLTILPVTDYLSSRFTDTFVENHIIRYLKKANTIGAPLLNYLKDARFTDASLFINCFFMNKIGRQKFTKIFIEDLKKKNIL